MEMENEERIDLSEEGLEAFYRFDENGQEFVVIMRGNEIVYKGNDRRYVEGGSETTAVPPKVEESVFGRWSVIIRNTAGFLSTIVVCATSVGFWWTTNESVVVHNVWPDASIILMTNIGPVMIAWAVINVNKTITTIFGVKDSLALIREKFSRVLKK